MRAYKCDVCGKTSEVFNPIDTEDLPENFQSIELFLGNTETGLIREFHVCSDECESIFTEHMVNLRLDLSESIKSKRKKGGK